MFLSKYSSDKLKVLSIISACVVVMQHFSAAMPVDGVWNRFWREIIAYGIFDYAVSFFFIQSGYFLVKDCGKDARWYVNAIKRRAKTLLIPYIVWNSIGIAVIGGGYGLFDMLPVITPLWYVRNLFVLCVLSPFFAYAAKKVVATRFGVALGVAVILVLSCVDLPAKRNIVMAAVYFFIGVAIRFMPEPTFRWRHAMPIVFLLSLACCLATKIIMVFVLGLHLGYIRYFMIPAVIGTIWFYLDMVFPKRTIGNVAKSASYAFPIYVSHYFFLAPLLNSCQTYGFSLCMFYAISSIIVIVVSSIAIKRYCPAMYGILTGGR